MLYLSVPGVQALDKKVYIKDNTIQNQLFFMLTIRKLHTGWEVKIWKKSKI